jgi:hypothetical protein
MRGLLRYLVRREVGLLLILATVALVLHFCGYVPSVRSYYR